MPCFQCTAQNHFECTEPDEGFCCCPPLVDTQPVGTIVQQRRGKDAADMRDPISTGRHRAALAAPITPGMACEWRQLRYAGGGVNPIIGCFDGIAQARHHGPDKDILNNASDNLHRICHTCHNRWHTANDEYYGNRPTPGTPFVPINGRQLLPHNTEVQATPDDIMKNELYWTSVKVKDISRDADTEEPVYGSGESDSERSSGSPEVTTGDEPEFVLSDDAPGN